MQFIKHWTTSRRSPMTGRRNSHAGQWFRSCFRPINFLLAGALATLPGLSIAQSAAAATGTFTTLLPPLTSSIDYLTGFDSCGPGPVGTRVEATRIFVVDYCSGVLYRFPVTGGDTHDAGVQQQQTGLNGGITKLGGTYYGIIQGGGQAGVWTFNPDTLTLDHQVANLPSGVGVLRDVLGNETTGELWVSGDAGVFRMRPPETTLSLVAAGNFDGLGISGDGSAMYAANLDQSIRGYNATSGAEVLNASVPGGHGIDGIATSGPDLYVNSNDGTIERIELSSGAVTVVASGGSRGDFVAVGPDGSLYATQSDRVEKLTPNIFNPAPGPTPDQLSSLTRRLVRQDGPTIGQARQQFFHRTYVVKTPAAAGISGLPDATAPIWVDATIVIEVHNPDGTVRQPFRHGPANPSQCTSATQPPTQPARFFGPAWTWATSGAAVIDITLTDTCGTKLGSSNIWLDSDGPVFDATTSASGAVPPSFPTPGTTPIAGPNDCSAIIPGAVAWHWYGPTKLTRPTDASGPYLDQVGGSVQVESYNAFCGASHIQLVLETRVCTKVLLYTNCEWKELGGDNAETDVIRIPANGIVNTKVVSAPLRRGLNSYRLHMVYSYPQIDQFDYVSMPLVTIMGLITTLTNMTYGTYAIADEYSPTVKL